MAAPEILSSKQLTNALAVLKHFNSDWDAFAELFAPDFTHDSRNAPEENKEQLLGFLNVFCGTFERLAFLPPTEVIQATDVVVLHVHADGVSKEGRQYTSEFLMIFRFAGEKISSTKEFMDSKYLMEYFA
ncbi:hypothetical protein FB45DRAFT_1054293 [Roridomyces roridus]|uniref:SnoaL-like domain-containing protein n=1 Tax=Roridomyces roridus TaxID=1738132 RepID=A0AAD7C8F3_9AGAR|nr:hypothetical protein FB45DRAFT_1054293 [Roridomyces roridus]